jgi:hypothetical protein
MGRLILLGKTISGWVNGTSSNEDATSIDLWNNVCPQLEGALDKYSKLNSGSLPEKAWFRASKARYQQELDTIIDTVIRILEMSGAAGCREEVRALQRNITESLQQVAAYREQLISAPSKSSLFSVSSIWTEDRESLEASIRDEQLEIEGMRDRISQLKEQFRNQLHEIGIEVFDDEIDYLLMPVTKDDIISMAAIVTNIASITAQLEKLTEDSKELQSHTKRYYGMYLLLVYSIDRVQTRFIQEIEHVHLPKLRGFEQEARKNITEAKNQISSGGPKDQLRANIDAGNTTIEACHCFANTLREQRDAISRENEHTKRMLAAAINTYKTVLLSLNVAELMSDCQKAFQALRGLKLPRLRTFQNLQLKGELQRLTERMLDPET